MDQFDNRIVRIGIEIDGRLKIYEGLQISASGTKYANANQNECQVQITNMDKATRDYILTETSPFNKNKKPKRIIVEAGRQSYGVTQLFIGDITESSISQPPDIVLTLKALTSNAQKGNVVARSQASQASLKKISEQTAKDLGVSLDFQAKDKNIGNYAFSGAALKQVDKINEMGNVNAFVDDNVLVVKDADVPLNGKLRKLDLGSGMIGIPEVTETGVKVTFLIDNQTSIGSALEITSKLNPSLNGTYVIYKLSFNVATRDTPFYYIAECTRL